MTNIPTDKPIDISAEIQLNNDVIATSRKRDRKLVLSHTRIVVTGERESIAPDLGATRSEIVQNGRKETKADQEINSHHDIHCPTHGIRLAINRPSRTIKYSRSSFHRGFVYVFTRFMNGRPLLLLLSIIDLSSSSRTREKGLGRVVNRLRLSIH